MNIPDALLKAPPGECFLHEYSISPLPYIGSYGSNVAIVQTVSRCQNAPPGVWIYFILSMELWIVSTVQIRNVSKFHFEHAYTTKHTLPISYQIPLYFWFSNDSAVGGSLHFLQCPKELIRIKDMSAQKKIFSIFEKLLSYEV